MNVVPFEPAHLALMRVQDAQARGEWTHPDALTCPFGQAWTAMVDGVPMVSAGLVELWQDRAYAWAVVSQDAGPHMLAITRAIRCRLDRAPFARIEMAVEAGFAAAFRWARVLGFTLETPQPMPQYAAGRSYYLFARTHG